MSELPQWTRFSCRGRRYCDRHKTLFLGGYHHKKWKETKTNICQVKKPVSSFIKLPSVETTTIVTIQKVHARRTSEWGLIRVSTKNSITPGLPLSIEDHTAVNKITAFAFLSHSILDCLSFYYQ